MPIITLVLSFSSLLNLFMTTVAIVGAGFSGLLTAYHLLKDSSIPSLHIYLIDKKKRAGRGLAYGTWDDNFLLNVPAGNMSAIADDPQHFVRYCQGIDPAFNDGTFVSRRIYGDYLEDLLAQVIDESDARLEVITASVHAVKKTEQGQFLVQLTDRDALLADKAVLAFGHFASANPLQQHSSQFTAEDFKTTHETQWLEQADRSLPVVIIGSGLTAIDAIFKLSSTDLSRQIILVSRRGLLSQPHRTNPKAPTKNSLDDLFRSPNTIRAYVRALRLEIARREQQGGNWRDVINELRPYTPEIWQRFSVAERKRFLRQILPYWDTHRHRLAPIAHKRLLNLMSRGQVEVLAARVEQIQPTSSGWRLSLRSRQEQVVHQIDAAGIINCTGPDNDIRRIDQDLIQQLRSDALISEDPLHIGILTQSDYQTIDRQGQVNAGLYYIGPMLKASYWEAIAVPELRVHTACLAKVIAANLSA